MILQQCKWTILIIHFIILSILAQVSGVSIEFGVLAIIRRTLPLLVHNQQITPLQHSFFLLGDHHITLLQRHMPYNSQFAIFLFIARPLLVRRHLLLGHASILHPCRRRLLLLKINFDEIASGLVVVLFDVEHEMVLQNLIQIAPAALALLDLAVHE